MTGSEKRWKKSHTLLATAAIVVLVGGIVTGTVLINRDTTPPTADTSTSGSPTSTPTPEDTPSPDGDSSSEGGTVQPTPIGGKVLPEAMGGEEAIEALGDKIEFVAKRNNKTVDELKDLLLRDKTAQVSPSGFIVYNDSFTG